MIKEIFLGCFIVAAVASPAFAENTIFQTIGAVDFDGNTNFLYFRGDSKWGAPGCPNATYAQIKGDVAGRKEILSIALAAKMAMKRVRFIGFCDTDKEYFSASYIIVE